VTASRQWGSFRSHGHRAVVTAVDVAERLAKAADRLLDPYALSLAQFNLLTVLMSEAEGLPQSALGTRLVVSRANITGLVRRMLRRGLCRVESEPGDARVKRVRITPAGMRLVDRIEPAYFREIERVTGTMAAGELRKLAELLERVRAGMDPGRPATPPTRR